MNKHILTKKIFVIEINSSCIHFLCLILCGYCWTCCFISRLKPTVNTKLQIIVNHSVKTHSKDVTGIDVKKNLHHFLMLRALQHILQYISIQYRTRNGDSSFTLVRFYRELLLQRIFLKQLNEHPLECYSTFLARDEVMNRFRRSSAALCTTELTG